MRTALSAQHGVQLSAGRDFDIILMAWELEDGDYCEVLRAIRRLPTPAPVIAVLAAHNQASKAAALRAGAAGYIAQSFTESQIIDVMHATAQVASEAGSASLLVGPVEVDMLRQRAAVGGSPLNLTEAEFAALELLVLSRGHTLTRHALLNHIFSGAERST